MKLKPAILFRELLFNSPFRKHIFPKYPYNFTVPQLWFLCKCIEETSHIEGNIAEIGCATGWTTIFLNKYLDSQGIQKNYTAIDTFAGFVGEDIEFEVSNRNKKKELFGGFQVNKKKWFEKTMKQNGFDRVRVFEADVNRFDLKSLGPLSFVLLDVDLYRPIKKALPELFEVLSPGGIMVVDDCDPSDIRWDGSDQAYKEFMTERNLNTEIIHKRLGVVRKK